MNICCRGLFLGKFRRRMTKKEDKRSKRKWIRAESSRASSQPDEGRRSNTGRIFIVAECVRETKGKRKRKRPRGKKRVTNVSKKIGGDLRLLPLHSPIPPTLVQAETKLSKGARSEGKQTGKEEKTRHVFVECAAGSFFLCLTFSTVSKKKKEKKNSMQRSDY